EGCEPEPFRKEPDPRKEEGEPGNPVGDENRPTLIRAGASWQCQDEIASQDISLAYQTSVPFVEGTRFAWRKSTSVAVRRHRATALKQVSAMWWLLAP